MNKPYQSAFTPEEAKQEYRVLSELLRSLHDRTVLTQALDNLEKLPHTGPGDIAGQARANAIAQMVTATEKTNQELIGVYKTMYDDLSRVLFAPPCCAQDDPACGTEEASGCCAESADGCTEDAPCCTEQAEAQSGTY